MAPPSLARACYRTRRGEVEKCIRFARRAGYERVIISTNDVLVWAGRIHERSGFSLVVQEQHRSFGRDLVGQHWQRALSAPATLP